MLGQNLKMVDLENFYECAMMPLGRRCRMVKTKVPQLVYNAMFKAVFTENKEVLTKMIEAILDYCQLRIDIRNKEFIIKNNELPLGNY